MGWRFVKLKLWPTFHHSAHSMIPRKNKRCTETTMEVSRFANGRPHRLEETLLFVVCQTKTRTNSTNQNVKGNDKIKSILAKCLCNFLNAAWHSRKSPGTSEDQVPLYLMARVRVRFEGSQWLFFIFIYFFFYDRT